MIFLQLFLTFFIIGLFGFGGGYGMLSLIQAETVVKHHWLKNPCRLHLSVLQLLDAENLQKKLTENLLNSVKSWLNANSSVLFLRDTAKNHLL